MCCHPVSARRLTTVSPVTDLTALFDVALRSRRLAYAVAQCPAFTWGAATMSREVRPNREC